MHLFIPSVETDFHIYYSKLLYTIICFFKYFWMSLDLLEFFSIHSEGTHCITAGFHSDARRTIFSQQFLQYFFLFLRMKNIWIFKNLFHYKDFSLWTGKVPWMLKMHGTINANEEPLRYILFLFQSYLLCRCLAKTLSSWLSVHTSLRVRTFTRLHLW